MGLMGLHQEHCVLNKGLEGKEWIAVKVVQIEFGHGSLLGKIKQ